jgi:mono/diheme cytochrome c family protein
MRLLRSSRVALGAIAGCACLAALGAAPMTERLVQAVAEQRVTTVERALELLSPSLRSRYALVFDSRSLQQASFADPRVVLFGIDARFIVTFNGQAGQRGFDTLEMMEFDEQRNRFEFREIHFPEGSSPGDGAVVSEANPAKCVACHGQPLRPVWDTWPTWPGVYGEQYRAPLARSELDGLKSFLEAQPTHPRYRALRYVELFADPNTFVPGTKVLYAGAETEPPNAVLSRLLAKLSARMIAHEVASAPKFLPYRYALLGALSRDCGQVDAYFEEPFARALAPGLAGLSERSATATARQLASKAARLQPGPRGPADLPGDDVQRLDTFRFLVESLLGISTSQWTPALEKDTFDFSSPQPFSGELDSQLRAIVASSDASVRGLASLRDVGAAPRYCRYLQARSRAATRELRVDEALAAARQRLAARMDSLPSPPDASGRPDALRTCIACHEGGIGPALPFAATDELQKRLATGGYPRGTLISEILFRLSPEAGQARMPPGRILSDEERSALEGYFRRLASLVAGRASPEPAP